MAVFAHRIHLPLRKIHEIEKDHQARDWFWLDGYENEIKESDKKKPKSQKKQPTQRQEME